MRGWFAHHGDVGLAAGLDDELRALGRGLTLADQACCCPARPVVTVIMPPATGRPDPVDLLLCGHHWRAGREALRAAGATAYDEAGILIMPGGKEVPHASRQPGAAAAARPGP